MLDTTQLSEKARDFGVALATAINEDEPRNDIRRRWDTFINAHHPRVQIVLREEFYNGYYKTRNYLRNY